MRQRKSNRNLGVIISTMPESKTVYTTGEVAKLCNVAPRTVSKWFDAGHLTGYRIPGSKDRRIPVEHLVRFMRAYGIPMNGLDTGTTQVLLFDPDQQIGESVRQAIESQGSFEVTVVQTALEAGASAMELKPSVIIVDVQTVESSTQSLVRFARSLVAPQEISLIAIGTELGTAQGQALLQEGFDSYISKPFDVRALIELISNHLPKTYTSEAC